MTDDPRWYAWSAEQLDACAAKAELRINPIVYAEVSVGFARIEEFDDAMSSWSRWRRSAGGALPDVAVTQQHHHERR